MLNLHSILKAGVIGGFGILTTSSILESKMKECDTNVLQPIDTVSIIMPSYNEERFIEFAAASIREQSIIQEFPEMFEFLLVDSGSIDKTVKFAEPFVDKVVIAPRGKLTARNIAINEAKGNIIVSVDADSYYPYHWLNTLLETFNDTHNPSIVAVSGSTFDYTFPITLYLPAWHLFYYLHLGRNFIVGRNSAYYKHAHYLVGGFNEDIDQFDFWKVIREEESLFGDRLSQFGKVVYNLSASCYHLGGQKDLCRFYRDVNLANKNCDGYKFGKDRF